MQQPDLNNGNSQHDNLKTAFEKLIVSYDAGGTLLICGNGGSAADCEHIVGELMKGFCRRRPLTADDKNKLAAVSGDDAALLADKLQYGLPALSLVSHSALITAIANDLDGSLIFAHRFGHWAKLVTFYWRYPLPEIRAIFCLRPRRPAPKTWR